MNKLFQIIKGFKWPFILIFYTPLFYFLYKNNIWFLYSKYHQKPSEFKKRIWNEYMNRHAASISIDAKIKFPLILPHGVSGIFITQSAIIGSNVVIFQQVTIGANTLEGSKSYGAPVIADNVYIGAGAKVIGHAVIEENVRIGANAVIVKNVPANSVVVVENRIIEKKHQLDNTFRPLL